MTPYRRAMLDAFFRGQLELIDLILDDAVDAEDAVCLLSRHGYYTNAATCSGLLALRRSMPGKDKRRKTVANRKWGGK